MDIKVSYLKKIPIKRNMGKENIYGKEIKL